MNIIYAMTRNLYPFFLPTLTSLLEHNEPDKVYILAEDDRLPYALPDVCEVINVAAERQRFTGANRETTFTYMSMARALYAEILPVDKVIQLDIDTIVCDSLKPLWAIDLKDKWLAACPEHLGTYKICGDVYYNVGVAVFNLEQMRKDNAVAQLVELLNKRFLPCIEQDALNIIGQRENKFVSFPVRYNECFCCGQTENPAVVHFAGSRFWWKDDWMPRHEYLDKYKGLYDTPPGS